MTAVTESFRHPRARRDRRQCRRLSQAHRARHDKGGPVSTPPASKRKNSNRTQARIANPCPLRVPTPPATPRGRGPSADGVVPATPMHVSDRRSSRFLAVDRPPAATRRRRAASREEISCDARHRRGLARRCWCRAAPMAGNNVDARRVAREPRLARRRGGRSGGVRRRRKLKLGLARARRARLRFNHFFRGGQLCTIDGGVSR